jgi:hypothetical protein
MDETEDNDREEGQKKRSGKGSGDSGGIRLPASKFQEVTKSWEYLDAAKTVSHLSEFFSELPARASANVEVSWANLKNHGYAVVTNFLKFGQEISSLMHNLTRENIERLRSEYGIMVPGPTG